MHEMNDKVKSLLTIQISIILKDDNEIHFGFGPATSVFLMFSGVPAVWNKSYFVTNLATTMTVTQV